MVRAAHHRVARREAVALMGKLAANHLADRAHRKVSRLFDTSLRVRHHAGGELLPAAATFDARHLPSPNALAAERQRSVLESLIANIAPAEAPMIAAALLNEFSSLSRIFTATREAIERVVGSRYDITTLLQAAHGACVESLNHEVRLKTIRATDQALIDYLVASMGAQPTEQLRVLFLDRQHRLLGDEIMASGSLSHITVYPRTIFKRAFELMAANILLVHNHPGGTPHPSQCDIDFTTRIAALGKEFEIAVSDHIIIAGARWFSFTSQGLL
jgi:DNA repair protein RadC